MDNRVIDGVRTKTGRLITSQKEVGGWPKLEGATAPADTDSDGMPDAWEISHKLNPNDAADASKMAADGTGYTNIETYLNSLAEEKSVQKE